MKSTFFALPEPQDGQRTNVIGAFYVFEHSYLVGRGFPKQVT